MTRSRSHANRGAAWEAQLALIHARYTSTGYALVGKLPAPFKVLHPLHSDTAHTAYALAWADIRAAWWAWSSTPSRSRSRASPRLRGKRVYTR